MYLWIRDTNQYRPASWFQWYGFVLYKYINVHSVTIPKTCTWQCTFATSSSAFHFYIRILLWLERCSLCNLLTFIICTLSSRCPGEQCKGGEGEQQQSCPCQLDPTHLPSGKRVSCVLCDISTISASWQSCMHCQHCQHQWFKCGDWRPWWPSKWIHHCCVCPHSRGQTTKLSSSRSVHATSVIGLT